MDCTAQSMDPCFARAIHGLPSTCAIHGLRNHLHMCQAFVQKKKGDQSRKKKGYRCLSFGWRTVAVRLRRAIRLAEVSWISPIRLPMCSSWTEELKLLCSVISQDNSMEQEESGSLPLNGMQCFRLAHDVLFREVLFAMNYLC